jgi:hypothetical protein
MEREWWAHSSLVEAIVKMLRDCDVELDDDLVRVVREIMAEPVAPPSDSDVLDTGGPEPMSEGGSVQGGVTIGDPGPQTIRERVIG